MIRRRGLLMALLLLAAGLRWFQPALVEFKYDILKIHFSASSCRTPTFRTPRLTLARGGLPPGFVVLYN